MRSHAGVAAPCSGAGRPKGINIQAISTSEIKVSVLIAEEYTELAVRALHTAYGLDAQRDADSGGAVRGNDRHQPPADALTACRGSTALMARGAAFLGSRHAILGGAMSWVSERHLVAAISNAGGFGVIACGAMPPALLAEEIAGTQALTHKPFGVNLITMHPRLDELIEVCLATKVGHVVLAGGIPPGRRSKRHQGWRRQGDLLRPRAGAGQEAGAQRRRCAGHRGLGGRRPYRPGVAHRAGAGDPARTLPDVPIFVAGGIGRGEAIAAYLEMGAAGAQLGTRFVCAPNASPIPISRRPSSAPRRATPCLVQLDPRLPVIPVRALKNAGTEALHGHQAEVCAASAEGELDKAEAQLDIEHFWAGALRRAVIDGDVENGSPDGRPVGRHGQRSRGTAARRKPPRWNPPPDVLTPAARA
jgi:enoyl-[acyl-carrier protein] reductase II